MQSLGTAALALLLLAGAATAARPAVSLTLPAEAAVAAADRVQSWSPPWFCHNLDCPKFEVHSKEEAFEVRQYAAATWVSTDVEAYAYALAANTGFKRLFQYIDGANHAAVKIPMTAPVRTRISASKGPFCKNNFTVSFFVPFAFQKEGVPKPNNPDIYVEESPAFTAYVAQAGGYVMDDYSIARMTKRLTDSLEEAGVPFNTEEFYFAGYDAPFRITGRHNEVWIAAEEERPASQQQ